METTAKPRVTITYCTGCNWLLRAGWMAQELLQTFGEELAEVAIRPGYGGVYEIRVVTAPAGDATGQDVPGQDVLLWERKRDGGFPEAKEIKKRLRDVIEPGRDLGHIDGHAGKAGASAEGAGGGASEGRGGQDATGGSAQTPDPAQRGSGA